MVLKNGMPPWFQLFFDKESFINCKHELSRRYKPLKLLPISAGRTQPNQEKKNKHTLIAINLKARSPSMCPEKKSLVTVTYRCVTSTIIIRDFVFCSTAHVRSQWEIA